MKTKLYIFLSTVLTLLAQTSCVFDKEPIDSAGSDDTESITLNLNLTIPSVSPGTRSSEHGLVSDEEAENYIDIEKGDFKVLIFDQNEKL